MLWKNCFRGGISLQAQISYLRERHFERSRCKVFQPNIGCSVMVCLCMRLPFWWCASRSCSRFLAPLSPKCVLKVQCHVSIFGFWKRVFDCGILFWMRVLSFQCSSLRYQKLSWQLLRGWCFWWGTRSQEGKRFCFCSCISFRWMPLLKRSTTRIEHFFTATTSPSLFRL